MARFAGTLILLLIAVLFTLPLIAGSFVLFLVIQILILAVFSLGFNLLFGYTGLLSFGQAGFYAMGAYACAKTLLAVPSLPLGLLAGCAAATLAAFLLGTLAIRHTQIYFSMLTLAFGMMIFSLAWQWRDVTGGDDGLVGIPRAPLALPGIFTINVASLERYYFVVLVVSLLAIVVMYRLVRSPLGLTLQSIRDSETRSAFAGISIRQGRLIAFTIAGVFAGLAGALVAPVENTVTPVMAHWSTSAEPVLATLLGGIHTFAGPIVGAVLLVVIKEIIVRFTIHWSIVLGVVVIVLVMGFRGGVVSIVAQTFAVHRASTNRTGP